MTAYEIGLKNAFLHVGPILNAAVYYIGSALG